MIDLGAEHPPAAEFAYRVVAAAELGHDTIWGVSHDIALGGLTAVKQAAPHWGQKTAFCG